MAIAGRLRVHQRAILLQAGIALTRHRCAPSTVRVFSFVCVPDQLESELLVELIVSDGAELREVNTDVTLNVAQLAAVFAAAPRLQVLNARVKGQCSTLLPVLRNDTPYGPLRVSKLFLSGRHSTADDLLALAAAVAAHESLSSLTLSGALPAQGLNALVDAAAERRVSRLKINYGCLLNAESVPALVRLLQRGSLTGLVVCGSCFPHEPEATMPVLCAALRACRTLTSLGLRLDPHNGASRRTVTQLLYAAASLPALSELSLSGSEFQDTAAFGHALGALLAANPPSLHTLDVGFCHLGDEGMAPLLEGLAANTHLRVLWYNHNNLSEAFQHDRLAPALAPLTARAALYRRMARSL
jgi:hypothetical protein